MSDYFPSYRTSNEMNKTSEKYKRQNEKTAHSGEEIEVCSNNNKNGLREPMKKLMKNENDGCDSVDQNIDEEDSTDLNLENKEVFSTKTGSCKKNKKLKTRRKKGGQSQPLLSSNVKDIDDELDDMSPQDGDFGNSKESSSLDSGIESDHLVVNKHEFVNIDRAFIDFLSRHDNDEFLDSSIKYVCPKFTCNRVDNVMAFTLHAKNVQPDSIKAEKLTGINAARVKFTSFNYASKVQSHYAFFVQLMVHNDKCNKTGSIGAAGACYKNNNDTANAIIQDVFAESWDNNVVFQIDLEPSHEVDVAEYKAGVDHFHLEPYPLESKMETMSVPEENESDEGLSIEVENSSENEIKIAIKSKDSEGSKKLSTSSEASGKRRNKKKNRLRSASESYCDELKVISESASLKNNKSRNEPRTGNHLQEIQELKEPVRKSRSISESYHERDGPNREHLAPKYKSILKNSYDHTGISIDSSVDDLFYSVSFDGGSHRYGSMGAGGYGSTTTDHELSESCKKSVRFSEHITRQLYKSNSSILGQRKKNQRKNDAKKRALQRRNSECESADDEHRESHEESPEAEDGDNNKQNCRSEKSIGQQRKNSMIFELEIDDGDDDED